MSSPSGPSASSTSDLTAAVDALRRGGLVVFPTETVYGVGADATNAAAVERLFDAKGRPSERAVTVHLGRGADLHDWAAEVSDDAARLAAELWPGPLTLVVPARPGVLPAVRGGGAAVGLRVPDHPMALDLLDAFGGGVVGSSANRHGEPPAATVDDARAALGDAADAYLDGGPCRLGTGSTVLDLTGDTPTVLRAGALPAARIEAVLGKAVASP